MSLYPVYLPNDVEITYIARTVTPDYNSLKVNPRTALPIDISTGSSNVYIVTGRNLDKIISVNWYPAIQTNTVFKMIAWHTYNDEFTQAMFGISVLDQNTFDFQRGGSISFRDAIGNSVAVPAATFSTYPWLFNPQQIPLQGWDTGAQDNGGGAY